MKDAKSKDTKSKIKFVTITELSRKATLIIAELEMTGGQIIITKKGKPVVTFKKFEDSDLEG